MDLKETNHLKNTADIKLHARSKRNNSNTQGTYEILFSEGDNSSQMYFLKSGKLKVIKKKGNQDLELGQIFEGELVGEVSFFDKGPRTATVIATEDSELAIIPSDKFQKIFDELPNWYQALTVTLVKRIRRTDEDLCT